MCNILNNMSSGNHIYHSVVSLLQMVLENNIYYYVLSQITSHIAFNLQKQNMCTSSSCHGVIKTILLTQRANKKTWKYTLSKLVRNFCRWNINRPLTSLYIFHAPYILNQDHQFMLHVRFYYSFIMMKLLCQDKYIFISGLILKHNCIYTFAQFSIHNN